MNKISLITGGTSGLGKEIARVLIEQNENVLIVGRSKAGLDSASQELKAGTHNLVESIECNVGESSDVKSLFSYIAKQDYSLERVYNTAGVGRFGSPEEVTADLIKEVFEGNLIGLINVCVASLKQMSSSGGHIVNIMSTAAMIGRPKESVYCAAKWGARGYTEALKAAVKGSNVKVTGVYPGGMQTPFWSKGCGADPDTSSFMNPYQVAQRIVAATLEINSSFVSDITIDRV